MFKKLLLVILVAVAAFLGYASTLSDAMHVSRSATIAASPAVVHDLVNDLHKWPSWSPWEKLDPAMKHSYEGPGAGMGAASSWVGNSKAGEGTMTITASKPAELVKFRLDFKKPFAATNDCEFTFKPEGDKTAVTWTMTGKKNLMFKAIGLIMDCEKMCGDDFERGLGNLATVAAAVPAAPVAAPQPVAVPLPAPAPVAAPAPAPAPEPVK